VARVALHRVHPQQPVVPHALLNVKLVVLVAVRLGAAWVRVRGLWLGS
jgi:hypothetical protein